jgi:hypothetical protein
MTPNDPAAALAEAVRAYLKTYTGDYNIAEESKLGTALADYEETAKAVQARQAEDLLEAAQREYPRDKNLQVQLKKLLASFGHNEIKG